MKLIKETMSEQDFIELQNQFKKGNKTDCEYPTVHKGNKNIKHKPKKMKFWNLR